MDSSAGREDHREQIGLDVEAATRRYIVGRCDGRAQVRPLSFCAYARWPITIAISVRVQVGAQWSSRRSVRPVEGKQQGQILDPRQVRG